MRAIERTNAFKRDFKKHGEISAAFIEVLWKLGNDEVLPERFRDHALTGNWFIFEIVILSPTLS